METRTQQAPALKDRADVIDVLVNTYRELNTRYRPVGDDVLRTSGARDILERMRMDEMLFAQALRERLTGVATAPVEGQNDPVLGLGEADDSTVNLISQFGNARATTLTLLKQAQEEDWHRETGDGKTVLQHAQELAESDRNQLAKLASAVGRR
jgi:hypothetical protein